jgi:1-acyl-sn-glycerol-3-phosphate acyltransferase
MDLEAQAEGHYPHYPVPWRALGPAVLSLAAGSRRSFATDAQRAAAALGSSLVVLGSSNIPRRSAFVVVCNHYSRRGFGAWWIAIAVSAAIADSRAPHVGRNVTWLMTEAWTYPESAWKRRHLTPLTRRLFRRIASVYGFIPMPPMPPDPGETTARAISVLRTVRLARTAAGTRAIIGLAPEGMDSETIVGRPAAGAGRFIALLVGEGLQLLPVGVVEAHGKLCVSFGALMTPSMPSDRGQTDRVVSRQVMQAISTQVECALQPAQ